MIITGFFLVTVYRALRVRAARYTLTNEQLVMRLGLVGRAAHYIELYRVKDIIINQNFFERILGLMDVSIISIDAATPVFTMRGLPYSPDLQLQMRNLAQQCRMKYNVYSVN
jgi:membrane protein YdbS with pleckstrin-like domain